MSTKTVLLAAAVLVLAGLGVRFALDLGSAGAAQTAAIEAPGALEPDGPGGTALNSVEMSAGPARTSESAATAPRDSQPAAPAAAMRVEGRVFDGAGNPLPRFRIRLEPALGGIDSVTTRADGTFPVSVPAETERSSRVAPVDPDFTVLFSRSIMPTTAAERPPLLAVAEARRFIGLVQTPAGEPIAGAACRLTLPEGFRARFDDLLVHTNLNEWTAQSNEFGHVELPEIPALNGCLLAVSAEGYQAATWPAVSAQDGAPDKGAMLLELSPLDPRLTLRGVVLDPSGSPVEGAYVGHGLNYLETTASGEFEFQLDPDPALRRGPQRLLAAAEGWIPVTFAPKASPAIEPGAQDLGASPAWIELRLTMKARTIAGVVLDPEGRPKEGAVVWLEDPTPVGRADTSMPIAEHIGGDRSYLWQRFTTDNSGRFEIPRLGDRNYRVRAIDPVSLHLSEDAVVESGARDVQLQLDREVQLAEVGGRVLDQAGTPVGGAKVSLHRRTLFISIPGGSAARFDRAETDAVVTEPDGSFTLGVVALHQGTTLQIWKKDYAMLQAPVAELPLTEPDLLLTLEFSCTVRVIDEGPPGSRATWFILKDPAGEMLQLTVFNSSQSVSMSTSCELQDGESPTVRVSGAAVTVDFYGEGGLLESRAIRLAPGDLNEIRR